MLSTYNVLEAATRLGVRKVVFASSETTYGICFAQGERRPLYVPVDEEHPTVPEDAYAMSKVAGEVTARSFQARTGADVYGLRINNVIEPHEYAELFPAFLDDPSLRRRNVFAYIDARDLGQMVQRCLETDGLGYEVFNVANADMSVAATTAGDPATGSTTGWRCAGRWAATRPSTPSTRRATCSASPHSTPGATCSRRSRQRPPRASSVAMSSSVRVKPPTSALDRIRSGCADFGITTTSCWRCHRMMTWAGVRSSRSAIATIAGWSRVPPRRAL